MSARRNARVDDKRRSRTSSCFCVVLHVPTCKKETKDDQEFLTMENLAQCAAIREKIKVAPRVAILALYCLIFQEDGDRGNRKRIREFSGFDFNDDLKEFHAKLEYAAGLMIGDLTSICNILGINYSGNEEQLRDRIIRGLMDINTLLANNEDEEEDEENDEEDAEEGGGDVSLEGESTGGSAREGDDRRAHNSGCWCSTKPTKPRSRKWRPMEVRAEL